MKWLITYSFRYNDTEEYSHGEVVTVLHPVRWLKTKNCTFSAIDKEYHILFALPIDTDMDTSDLDDIY